MEDILYLVASSSALLATMVVIRFDEVSSISTRCSVTSHSWSSWTLSLLMIL